jgi:subtilisin family serine protease
MHRARSLAAAVAVVTALLAAGGGQSADSDGAAVDGAAAWRGFLDAERAPVAIGQRMIVVLRNPSLADRIAENGGTATESAMRQWTAGALAAQKQIAARLSGEGIQLVPDFVYTRTFNGFAAPIDSQALALLERDEDVVGVYPVRAAFPAALSAAELRGAAFAPGSGRRPELGIGIPGFDGAGVTVALLDTGVDATHPFVRERLRDGIDVLDPDGSAVARTHPQEPGRVERHGTQLAGVIAGSGGPAGLRGVAPGASILPIRVAGWQPSGDGYAVYGRTDQLLAGLERAVDPDADGDVLDAARVAVVGVSEPFASFSDGPVARAIEGAAHLDTLVVVPAGNDGPAGPGYGSIGGPGGAPAALTVGAVDVRRATPTVRVVVRAGLRVLLDRQLPLAGAAAPAAPLRLTVARPRRDETGPGRSALRRYFDDGGFSLVAGKATLLGRASDPTAAARAAVQAGAAAVLVDGVVPAGALGLDDRLDVPVVGVPRATAAGLRSALARGLEVSVSVGAPGWRENPRLARIAAFSSHGLAFGGGVKPEATAPGVELVTADPGRNPDRTARYATVSGTSAAAALAGGAAALLAQARPELDATALKGALVGTGEPLDGTAPAAQGGGGLDPLAAASAEVVAEPATVAFGSAAEPGWTAVQRIVVRNVSRRRVTVDVAGDAEGIAGLSLAATPDRVGLRPGESATVALRARLSFRPRGLSAIQGRVRLELAGGGLVYVPWAVALPAEGAALIGGVELSETVFAVSDRAPAVLTVQAGQVRDLAGRRQVRPLQRLDVELWRGERQVGLVARLRDVLPGRYAFGLTGRGPRGGALAKGVYRLRIVAVPPEGEPEAEVIDFRLR